MNSHPRTAIFLIVGAALTVTLALKVFASTRGNRPEPFVLMLDHVHAKAATAKELDSKLKKYGSEVSYDLIHFKDGDFNHLPLPRSAKASPTPTPTPVQTMSPAPQVTQRISTTTAKQMSSVLELLGE